MWCTISTGDPFYRELPIEWFGLHYQMPRWGPWKQFARPWLQCPCTIHVAWRHPLSTCVLCIRIIERMWLRVGFLRVFVIIRDHIFYMIWVRHMGLYDVQSDMSPLFLYMYYYTFYPFLWKYSPIFTVFAICAIGLDMCLRGYFVCPSWDSVSSVRLFLWSSLLLSTSLIALSYVIHV